MHISVFRSKNRSIRKIYVGLTRSKKQLSSEQINALSFISSLDFVRRLRRTFLQLNQNAKDINENWESNVLQENRIARKKRKYSFIANKKLSCFYTGIAGF